MNFNKADLRNAERSPVYSHEEHVSLGLVDAEATLHTLERSLKEKVLRGNGVQANKINSRLAKLLGKKEEVKADVISTKGLLEEAEKDIHNDPYLQALYSHKQDNVISSVRDYRAIHKCLEEAEILKTEIESSIYAEDNVDISLREALDEVNSTIRLLQEDKKTLLDHSPESYYVSNLLSLRDLKRQAKAGSIVETESVHNKRLEIESFVLAGRPIFLHGAPGTGKTEMAMHVAKLLPTAKEFANKIKYEAKNEEQPFMIISASKQTDSSELTGHQVINVKQMPEDERKKFIDSVEIEMNTWIEKNKDATEDQKNRQQQVILEAYKLTHGQGMETSFWTGPMYKCMEEGIPFIVDEANAMPPDVLIKINHLMTRRPGDTVVVQEDSGKEIKIKEGFCFIFTGNIGEQFQGRYRLEQSFVNRIGDAMVEYNYLPENELQEVLFAYLMEGGKGKGSIIMSPDDMDSLQRFTKAVCFAQNVFEGKQDLEIPDGSGGELSIRDHKLLKNTPLSMRNIFNIIDAYKKDNYSLAFEQYIYESFIKPIQDQGERYAYFQIFKANGFFPDENMTENINRDSNGKVIEFTASGKYGEKNDKYHVFTPRDVVDQLYGPYTGGLPEEDIEKASREGHHLVAQRDYSKVKVENSTEIDIEALEVERLNKEIEGTLGVLSKFIQEQEVTVGSVCAIK